MPARQRSEGHPEAGVNARTAVRRALAAARAALAEDPAAVPRPEALAAAAGVAPRSLQRHFIAVLGRSPQAEIERLRLGAARQTLCSGAAASVLEAALRHGFSHPGRFAIAYARAFGEAPSASLRAGRGQGVAAPAPTGTPLLLRPMQPADAPGARRAGDDLAIALGRMRDLRLLAPDAPAARALRLEGRVEAGFVTLSLTGPGGILVATLRERLDSTGWAMRAARRLLDAIRAEQVEQARRMPRHRADPETLVLRARPAMLVQDPALTGVALELVGEALYRDPSHARAQALAGFGHAVAANHCFVPDPAAARARALDHAARALALAGDDPEVLTLAAGVMSFTGRLEAAEQLVTRSLALDPGQPEAWRRLGILRIFHGDARGAGAIFRRLLRYWPEGHDGTMAMIQIGIADLALGRDAAAARMLSRALERQPFRAWPYRFLAAAAWHAGAREEARRSVVALRRCFPDLTVEQCDRSDALQPAVKIRILDALAQAGLPRC